MAETEFDKTAANSKEKEEKMPNTYQQGSAPARKNPSILGNTPYEKLGSKSELVYYANLNNRHAESIANEILQNICESVFYKRYGLA